MLIERIQQEALAVYWQAGSVYELAVARGRTELANEAKALEREAHATLTRLHQLSGGQGNPS